MARITMTSATPESWSADLPQRAVFYDPVHGEMVGAEVVDDTLTKSNALDEPSFQMDLVGDYAYPELFGDYPLPIEIISGDDGAEEVTEEDEQAEEDQPDDSSPENAPTEDEPEDVQSIEPQPDDTGPLPPPGFAPVSGPTGTTVPRASSPSLPGNVPFMAAPAAAVSSLASNIRARFNAGHPPTVRAVKKLAKKAKTSPFHRQALKVIAKKKPAPKKRRRPATGHGMWSRGEDVQIALGGITDVGTRVVRTVLVPVKWTADTSGTIVEGIGSFLQSLGRKL
jgi:hypothetical protein